MLRFVKNNFTMSAFDYGPTKYYDYIHKRVLAVDTSIFVEMMKIAVAHFGLQKCCVGI